MDCTTLDPGTARELAARVRATRVHAGLSGPRLAGLPAAYPTLLDAPVSGGVVGADKGAPGGGGWRWWWWWKEGWGGWLQIPGQTGGVQRSVVEAVVVGWVVRSRTQITSFADPERAHTSSVGRGTGWREGARLLL